MECVPSGAGHVDKSGCAITGAASHNRELQRWRVFDLDGYRPLIVWLRLFPLIGPLQLPMTHSG